MRVAAFRLLVVVALSLGVKAGTPPRVGVIDAGGAGSCVTDDCHSDQRAAAHVHAPVARGICRICHRAKSTDKHEFDLAREGRGMCSFCHWETDPEADVHNALLSVDCIVCHDPHASEYPRLLPTERSADLCEECHADLLDDKTTLHTPVVTEPCTACHDLHATRGGALPADSAGSCLRCHETVAEEIAASAHVHEPLRSGGCDDCHDPHGSNHAGNLREGVPALCLGCHREIKATLDGAEHRHSIAAEPDGCLSCHSPHGSPLSDMLRSDPLTLCSGCHSSEITKDDGATIAPVAVQIETSAYLHGPVRQRDCSACHDSHGSDHARLLVERYTPEFYAGFDPENYKLCFSCHPQRKVLTERTTDLTDFRNGNLNLHYLHVNKPVNGRTCRACHATHGSNSPKHIGEQVKFGSWDLPIAFEKTPTGGSCDCGCHSLRAYDREVPVDHGPTEAPDDGGGPEIPGGSGGPGGDEQSRDE